MSDLLYIKELLKRADEWSKVNDGTTHWEKCYLVHVPCLIAALAALIRELEAERNNLALLLSAGAALMSEHASEIERLRTRIRELELK